MRELKFQHRFSVINGKFIWDDKEMLEYKRKTLEGKRGYAIIEELEEEISSNQWGYYFGGIIRRECMASDVFAGWTDKEIHNHLFAELRSQQKGIQMPDGTVRLVTVTEDFSSYKKNDMAKYIDELIPHLNVEYQIYPKPSSHYKDNKFFMNPKILKTLK